MGKIGWRLSGKQFAPDFRFAATNKAVPFQSGDLIRGFLDEGRRLPAPAFPGFQGLLRR
jgi:hypothetical protein